MKRKSTWVVVADGSQARFFCSDAKEPGLKELAALRLDGPRDARRDIVADRPGRAFDSVGQGRHAMQPGTDPQREQERRFIAQVAAVLAEQIDAYEHLILTAAPGALGDLRKCLTRDVLNKVTAQIDKDLTNLSVAKIGEHVSAVANF